MNGPIPQSTSALESRQASKYLKLTDAEKRGHVQAYLKSNLSRQAYCEKNGLSLSSFKNWTTRHEPKRAKDFLPVVPAQKPEVKHKAPRIEIHKNDCKVILCEITNANVVIEIIRGVLSCNYN